MKYYYLINKQLMKGEKMPDKNIPIYNQSYDMWFRTLNPCKIIESELDKIIYSIVPNQSLSKNIPVDVTDMVAVNFECGLGKCVAEDGCCISCLLPKENLNFKKPKLTDFQKLLHIAEEMAKDLTEQSEFIEGSFESLAKYYNFKQNLNKQNETNNRN